LLNQAGDGSRAAVFTAFADLSVQFFGEAFGNTDAHNSAVAGTVFSHDFNSEKSFNKYA
jgi:hypothetical protein